MGGEGELGGRGARAAQAAAAGRGRRPTWDYQRADPVHCRGGHVHVGGGRAARFSRGGCRDARREGLRWRASGAA